MPLRAAGRARRERSDRPIRPIWRLAVHDRRRPRYPSPVRRRAFRHGVRQAPQAHRAADARGDRAVRDDRARRPLAGLPFGRQGQLHAPGRADRAQVARAPARRPPRLQSRPGPTRISLFRASRIPPPNGRAAPNRASGHIFHRDGQGARGPLLLLALLSPKARQSLPDRARGRLQRVGARPSSRRHSRDVLHEPLPWLASRRDAAEAAERRRRSVRLPTARPCRGSRLRSIREGDELPDHSLRPLRLAGRAAAPAGQGASRQLGNESSGTQTKDVPRPHEFPPFASS